MDPEVKRTVDVNAIGGEKGRRCVDTANQPYIVLGSFDKGDGLDRKV